MTAPKRTSPAAACPLRMNQPCNLCHPDAYVGPQDCPTVAMIMDDPLLREAHYALRAGLTEARKGA